MSTPAHKKNHHQSADNGQREDLLLETDEILLDGFVDEDKASGTRRTEKSQDTTDENGTESSRTGSDEEILATENSDEHKPRSAITGWVISAGVHGLLFLLFGALVWIAKTEEIELPPMRVNKIDPPAKVEENKNLERALDNKVEINVAIEAPVAAPISPLDVPLEEQTTSEDNNEANIAKGREEAVSSNETGSTGVFMTIGTGGGAAGMFGSRSGGGKRRALAKGGGSWASENAVDAALRWFTRHQSPDGSWDIQNYMNNCREDGPKCEPGHYERGETSRAGITGLVVLCYLGAGYDHMTPNKYKKAVSKGIDWIIAMQTADGSFMAGAYNYEQAIATMTMGETFAMTDDPRCKDAAIKGWNVLVGRRYSAKWENEEVWGWGDYSSPDAGQAIKTSATAWCIQAMKGMLAGGLDVGDAPQGLKRYLKAAWEGTVKLDGKDPRALDPYKDMSSLSYQFAPEKDGATSWSKDGNIHNLPGVGLVSAVFMSMKNNEAMEHTLGNYILQKQLPTAWPTNLYYLYYNTFGIFQLGGEYWAKYNGAMRDLLVNNQRTEPHCFDGSWDLGTNFAKQHGRVFSTALACLSLEVYYRYAQVHGKKVEKK